jgi:hypothetical protein
MKRFLVTLALTCVLSGTALAGEIPTMGVPSPAAEPDGIAQATLPGDMPTMGSTSPADMPTCGLSVLLTILNLAF